MRDSGHDHTGNVYIKSTRTIFLYIFFTIILFFVHTPFSLSIHLSLFHSFIGSFALPYPVPFSHYYCYCHEHNAMQRYMYISLHIYIAFSPFKWCKNALALCLIRNGWERRRKKLYTCTIYYMYYNFDVILISLCASIITINIV